MAPLRRDFRQRFQDKAAFGQPWVRQNQRLAVRNDVPIGQQVEIKCARRVFAGTDPPEIRFDSVQKFQQRNGL